MRWNLKYWPLILLGVLSMDGGKVWAATATAATAAVSQPPQDPLLGINVEDFSDTKKNGKLHWDKNPFVQPLKEADMGALRVEMIVYGPSFSAALVNGEILREGDKLGSIEVVKIYQKHLILRNEDGIFRLELRGKDKDAK